MTTTETERGPTIQQLDGLAHIIDLAACTVIGEPQCGPVHSAGAARGIARAVLEAGYRTGADWHARVFEAAVRSTAPGTLIELIAAVTGQDTDQVCRRVIEAREASYAGEVER